MLCDYILTVWLVSHGFTTRAPYAKDELHIHDTVAFEILCEKERWAHGGAVQARPRLESALVSKVRPNEEKNALNLNLVSELAPLQHGRLARVACGESCWTLELNQVNSVHSLGMLNDSARQSSERTLDLELCMVGTYNGRPECFTRQTNLQVWKVVSPRSFVSQPSMSAIREECDLDADEDDAVTALERCHMVRRCRLTSG